MSYYAGSSAAPRFVVLNDAPVGDGVEDDLMEATEVARGLAELIVASRAAAPFALAVDAAWGMGKSSLMHRLKATLAAQPAVSVVWFNAWTSGRASALEGLIKSVLLRFDRNVIRRAVRSMSRRAHLLGALRALGLVLGSFFGLGRVVDEMWRRMALDAQSRNEIKGVLRDAFTAWIERGGGPGGRRLLVVFVDDLDRCASERIVEVCEAIKLYLDVPGIVFVLGCDQSALWRAVRDSAGIADSAGAVEYLEKIIQINYRIPVPSAAHAVRLVNGYLARSHTSALFDESMKNMIIERSGRNPRRIKRLINSFVLEYHLNRSWDDVGVENLVKVIMLQHFYPGFHQILTNPRHDDPITEFLQYNEFRTAVRQGSEPPAGWEDMVQAKGLRPHGWRDLLPDLEKELPAEFPTLAADRDFVALIESFDGPGIDTARLRRMLRRPLTTADRFAEEYDVLRNLFWESARVPLTPEARLPRAPSADDPLEGLRILWIDDNPGSNREMAAVLLGRGAFVTQATNRATALAAIEQRPPDVVLSDFGRGRDDEAGLNDLEYFRKNRIFEGPVLFCSGQGIPERKQRIQELGADGPTNDENEILRWLEQAAPTAH
ncbi:MAG TPA: P-loop NTPase fold protein [Actinophytocola sp.]|uniref:P-loop NTPase fold protein n=1 Tax=Actinophytocola sp. TaxID=1872138 RepID=UPI002DDCAEC1|nr:P-loop NTPase fold protein [Actinophytocola sp.]HEV2781831.1 P-loop NTPase fold protein [Actinophytocola sp.]